MTPENKKSKRLMGVFLLGWLLLSYPLLSLFNKPGLFLGIPLLYLYVFSVWACLIALMYLVALGSAKDADKRPRHGGRDA